MTSEKKVYEVVCTLSTCVSVFIRATSPFAAREYVEQNYDGAELFRMTSGTVDLDDIALCDVAERPDCRNIQVHGEAVDGD